MTQRRKVRKKRDCDSRNMAPTLENKEGWKQCSQPGEHSAQIREGLSVQILSGKIQAGRRCVWYCRTTFRNNRHAGRTNSLVAFIAPTLYTVEIPSSCTTTSLLYALPFLTSLTMVFLGTLTSNLPESLLLSLFS